MPLLFSVAFKDVSSSCLSTFPGVGAALAVEEAQCLAGGCCLVLASSVRPERLEMDSV